MDCYWYRRLDGIILYHLVSYTSNNPLFLLSHFQSCNELLFLFPFFFLFVLIQVYNWEIWHHSLVCCCGFADILNVNYPLLKTQGLYFQMIIQGQTLNQLNIYTFLSKNIISTCSGFCNSICMQLARRFYLSLSSLVII